MANEDKNLVAQSDDEKRLKQLNELKLESGNYRKQFEKDWKEYEQFYYGDHWRFAKKRPVKNWIFSIIEGEIPVLTDSRPSTDVLPLEQQHEDAAKILEAGIHSVFETERLMLKQTQAVRASLLTGTGWMYCDYDPDKERGDGNVLIRNIGWRHIWIDPKAIELDEAEYAIIEFPTSVPELKRRFPKQAGKIKPTGTTFQEFADIKPDGTRADKWSPDLVTEMPKGRFEGQDIAILEEYWIKDYTMESIPEADTLEELEKEREQLESGVNPDIFKYEDHEAHLLAHATLKVQLLSEVLNLPLEEITEEDLDAVEEIPEINVLFKIIDDHIEAHKELQTQNPDGKRPKYTDNLRLVLKVGKEILFDGSHPEGDGRIPLTPIYCYKAEDSIYGIGEVKNILSPQKSFNELDWAEHQGLMLTSNPGWVVDEESGVDTDTLTNEPGIVVKKKQGTEARRLEPGAVSPQLDSRKQNDRFAIEAISGINEASQGRRPTGITAASAIRALQEQSVGRIRLKTRMLEEYSMLRLGECVATRIVNHWTVERKLRVYDRNGQIQFIEFDPSKVQQLKYDIRTVPGSTAGLDKESIFTVMKELLTGGAIDVQTFFETTDLPFKATLMERAQERDELTQQAQQLALENEELKLQVEEVLGLAEGTDQDVGQPPQEVAPPQIV